MLFSYKKEKLLIFLKAVFDVFRPLRWYRNLFMLFGVGLAFKLNQMELSSGLALKMFLAFVAICFIASGNYGINEILDAESDRHHPQKKFRAIPSQKISVRTVLILSILFYGIGLFIAAQQQNMGLFISIFLLFFSGMVYNVPPVRIKDYPYLDFLGEALNNPIRLSIGWYSIASVDQVVPSSMLLAFWFLGAFLMAAKRFGEIRLIQDQTQSGQYRKSLFYYSEKNLLIAMVSCITAFAFMFGALCMKHGVDLILLLPFVVVFIIWFLNLAYEPNSIVKDPERVFEKKGFFFYSAFLVLLFFYLVYSQNQFLGFLL